MRVAFTANGRPGYLATVLDSWLHCAGAERADLTFHLEPPKADLVAREIAAVKDYFGQVRVVLNAKQFGSPDNPKAALDRAFSEGHEFVVLAEDDSPVSPDVIEFFEWCEETYRKDHSVVAVCSNQRQFPDAQPSEATHVMGRWKFFRPTVWGTWIDRWRTYIEPGWATFDRRGWDWSIGQRVLTDPDLFVAAPIWSRSTHIGKEGGHVTEKEENYVRALPPNFLTEYVGRFKDVPVPRFPGHTGALCYDPWMETRQWTGDWFVDKAAFGQQPWSERKP